ncbi:putative damage-inducible protein DinB [Flavobacterium sp. CG_23.5]|uniref:DinB family protein n=1 Tax=Flavobacterium sp. CG_23.5 TaxID=2760708 RepID=UPI001AE26B9B|nr:DinB family protein [Flavobacterium sp. CG_23.5]MBP2284841.1 putative damage-inducible protein DinB [Flavobacterium sp. CG_23.5]
MINIILTGSIKALLDEYKKAIDELISNIKPLNESQLCIIVDNYTEDTDCKSIQTVLTHIVCSGYGYTIYMENAIGLNKTRPGKLSFNTVNQYINQLNLMFKYCENFFHSNPNLLIEQTDISKKIIVNWGQQYDIEQLLEHAIVHILRHRRQIENFIKKQDEQNIESK